MRKFKDFSVDNQIQIVIDFHRNAMDDLSMQQIDGITEYLIEFHTGFNKEDKLTVEDMDSDLTLQGFSEWWDDNEEDYKDL